RGHVPLRGGPGRLRSQGQGRRQADRLRAGAAGAVQRPRARTQPARSAGVLGRGGQRHALPAGPTVRRSGTLAQPAVPGAYVRPGRPTTAERERDIAFTDIIPVPSPVAIKGKLTVKGLLDAPGFENVRVKVRLFMDDKEVLVQEETLRKTLKNEVSLVTDAPSARPKDGEIKVTLKVDPV